MGQESHVFDVVICLVLPGGLLLRVPGVDPLQDTEATAGMVRGNRVQKKGEE